MEGRVIRLEPLSEDHTLGLMAAADSDIFPYMNALPAEWTEDAWRDYVRRVLTFPQYFWAMVLQESGQAVGMSSYMDVRPAHRGLEIGSTWIGRDYHGTPVNPESKLLMLGNAFENLGAVRVQLKTDGRNAHSQRAIAKLGAKWEGVLRKHIVCPDGYIRDTVMYSITEAEWPDVRAGLVERLGYDL